MKSKFLTLLALSAALVTGRAVASEIDDNAANFTKLANGIISQTVAGKLDVAAVKRDVLAMEKLATFFAGKYKDKYPQGAKLMEFIISKRDSLTGMTLESIDASFESEAINKAHGKEIGFDLTTEANEHFGNPIDLFVHPATASICADLWDKNHSADHLKRIQSELQEVIEHCGRVVANLKK